MWDLSSPTRNRTCIPCTGRQILNHWATREVPHMLFLFLAAPCSLWDLSSWPGVELGPSAVKARSPNHWTSRKFPHFLIKLFFYCCFEFFIQSRYKQFVGCMVCKYFFPVKGLSFHPYGSHFWCPQPCSKSWRFSFMLFSRNSIVLHFTFKLVYHF